MVRVVADQLRGRHAFAPLFREAGIYDRRGCVTGTTTFAPTCHFILDTLTTFIN